PGEEGAQQPSADLVGPDPRAGLLAEEADRLGQILPVGLDGVGRRVLLQTQVPEEVGQGLLHRRGLEVARVVEAASPSWATWQPARLPAPAAGPAPSGRPRRTRTG